MRNLLNDLQQYIHDTLALSLSLEKWSESKRLPFFLQDAYLFYRVQLLELDCIMMLDTRDQEESPAVIRKHMEQVRAKWDGEIIYARDTVTAYNRKRLIEQKLPFIVPGNQLYLPMLGLDLREHFRQKREVSPYFTPSTQVLVLHLIYGGNKQMDKRNTPTELARVLGYSKMTMTRAFREVESILKAAAPAGDQDLFDLHNFRSFPLWETTRQFMRSPVKKRLYVSPFDIQSHIGHLAGLSALADYSMLASPKNKVLAVSQEEWKTLRQNHQFPVLDDPEPQATEIEIWSYAPRLFGHGDAVDRLSLYLSLQDNHDERVEVALETLLEGMQW
jgi:hypothetical protein